VSILLTALVVVMESRLMMLEEII